MNELLKGASDKCKLSGCQMEALNARMTVVDRENDELRHMNEALRTRVAELEGSRQAGPWPPDAPEEIAPLTQENRK